jgi:hypothetical protein
VPSGKNALAVARVRYPLACVLNNKSGYVKQNVVVIPRYFRGDTLNDECSPIQVTVCCGEPSRGTKSYKSNEQDSELFGRAVRLRRSSAGEFLRFWPAPGQFTTTARAHVSSMTGRDESEYVHQVCSPHKPFSFSAANSTRD